MKSNKQNLGSRFNNAVLFFKDNTSHNEQEILNYIDKIPKKEVFYDLGSCVGYFTIYAIIRNLNVFSFEVDPTNYKGLCKNIDYNGFTDKINCYNIGIADGKLRKIPLFIGQDKVGGHHKTLDINNFSGADNIRNKKYKKINVDVISLDRFIENEKIPPPNHIKVDIDGSEYDFLKGATKTLKNLKSMIIEIEESNNFFNKIMEIIDNNSFSFVGKYSVKQKECKSLFNYEFTKK